MAKYHTITACKAPCNRTTGIAYPTANASIQFDSQELGYGPANFTPGPKRALVILMQIAGQGAPGSAEAVRSIVFTAPNSANISLNRGMKYVSRKMTTSVATDASMTG